MSFPCVIFDKRTSGFHYPLVLFCAIFRENLKGLSYLCRKDTCMDIPKGKTREEIKARKQINGISIP